MAQINFTAPSVDSINVRWGNDFDCQVFHLKRHPSASTSEALPCVVYIPGSADDATSTDGRSPFCANGDGNWLFDHLQSYTGRKFACIGFTGPTYNIGLQDSNYASANDGFNQTDVVGNSHTQGLTWPLPQQNSFIPLSAQVEYLKLFIMVLKSRAVELKIDPNAIFLFGSDLGGTRALLSQLTGVVSSNAYTSGTRSQYGLSPNVDSTVKGIINFGGPTEFRLNQSYVASVSPNSAAEYPVTTNVLSKTLPVQNRTRYTALPSYLIDQISVNWYLENKVNLHLLPPVYHVYPWYGVVNQRIIVPGSVISGAAITTPGTGYTNGETISLTIGSGTLQTGTIAVSAGAITSITVGNNAGANYKEKLSGETYDFAGLISGTGTGTVFGGTGTNGAFVTTGLAFTRADSTAFDTRAWSLGQVTFESPAGGTAAINIKTEISMLLTQKMIQNSGASVTFKYATPFWNSISDTYGVKDQAWVADISTWMTNILASNNVGITGVGPAYYGDYYYSGQFYGNPRTVTMQSGYVTLAYPPKWWGTASTPL